MAVGAHVLKLVEDFLAEAFEYHNELNAFLLRSGVSKELLRAARSEAEDRNKNSGKYSNAPKRYVVQELLTELATHDDVENHRIVSNLITSICNTPLERLPAAVQGYAATLKQLRLAESEEKKTLDEEIRIAKQQEVRTAERIREEAVQVEQAKRTSLLSALYEMHAHSDGAARGYALEAFLNELFHFEKLSPKGSFRLVGEQIDGSFALRGQTHLVEAKWTASPTAGAEFGAFVYKIEGKTADTRGLYVSINGYSEDALKSLRTKGGLKFICIDGAHLTRALAPHQTLKDVLLRCWRRADETGEAYVPVSKISV